MSLPAEIAEVPDRLSQIALDLRGSVQVIRGERPSEAVMNETAQLVLIIAAIGAESARLRALCAAAKDTGAMERPVMPPKELELHPRNLPLQVDEARLLESLHRAGDRTLDPDEERSTDGQA